MIATTLGKVVIARWRGIDWLLNDEFSDNRAAGSINGTLATDGRNVRTVLDTNSKLSVAGGELSMATGQAANDGIWYPSITRTPGRVLVARLTAVGAAGMTTVGFDADQSGAVAAGSMSLRGSGAVIYPDHSTSFGVGVYTPGIAYTLAVCLRAAGHFVFIKGGAFTNWTLLYTYPTGGLTPLYPAIGNPITGSIYTAGFLRIPPSLWLPSPLASDGFSTQGVTDGKGHDEGGRNLILNEGFEVAGAGGADVWGGWNETVGDGALADETSLVKSGGHAAKLTAGASRNTEIAFGLTNLVPGAAYAISFWTRGDGTNGGRYYVYDGDGTPQFPITETPTGVAGTSYQQVTATFTASTATASFYLKCPSVNTGIAYFDDVSVSLVNSSGIGAGGAGGAWTNRVGTFGVSGGKAQATVLDGGTSRAIATVNAGTPNALVSADVTRVGGGVGLSLRFVDNSNQIVAYHNGGNTGLTKFVNGVGTAIIYAAATHVPGAQLSVIADGTSFQLFYNGVKIGSTSTINDAVLQTSSLHGMYSTDINNTLDNFAVWARGTEGQYSTLDQWVNP